MAFSLSGYKKYSSTNYKTVEDEEEEELISREREENNLIRSEQGMSLSNYKAYKEDKYTPSQEAGIEVGTKEPEEEPEEGKPKKNIFSGINKAISSAQSFLQERGWIGKSREAVDEDEEEALQQRDTEMTTGFSGEDIPVIRSTILKTNANNQIEYLEEVQKELEVLGQNNASYLANKRTESQQSGEEFNASELLKQKQQRLKEIALELGYFTKEGLDAKDLEDIVFTDNQAKGLLSIVEEESYKARQNIILNNEVGEQVPVDKNIWNEIKKMGKNKTYLPSILKGREAEISEDYALAMQAIQEGKSAEQLTPNQRSAIINQTNKDWEEMVDRGLLAELPEGVAGSTGLMLDLAIANILTGGVPLISAGVELLTSAPKTAQRIKENTEDQYSFVPIKNDADEVEGFRIMTTKLGTEDDVKGTATALFGQYVETAVEVLLGKAIDTVLGKAGTGLKNSKLGKKLLDSPLAKKLGDNFVINSVSKGKDFLKKNPTTKFILQATGLDSVQGEIAEELVQDMTNSIASGDEYEMSADYIANVAASTALVTFIQGGGVRVAGAISSAKTQKFVNEVNNDKDNFGIPKTAELTVEGKVIDSETKEDITENLLNGEIETEAKIPSVIEEELAKPDIEEKVNPYTGEVDIDIEKLSDAQKLEVEKVINELQADIDVGPRKKLVTEMEDGERNITVEGVELPSYIPENMKTRKIVSKAVDNLLTGETALEGTNVAQVQQLILKEALERAEGMETSTSEVKESTTDAGYDDLTNRTFTTKGGKLVITEGTTNGNSVNSLFVDKDSRRQGIATKLLDVAKEKYSTISAQVSNEASVVLHYKAGFRPFNNLDATLEQTKVLFKDSPESLQMIYKKEAPKKETPKKKTKKKVEEKEVKKPKTSKKAEKKAETGDMYDMERRKETYGTSAKEAYQKYKDSHGYPSINGLELYLETNSFLFPDEYNSKDVIEEAKKDNLIDKTDFKDIEKKMQKEEESTEKETDKTKASKSVEEEFADLPFRTDGDGRLVLDDEKLNKRTLEEMKKESKRILGNENVEILLQIMTPSGQDALGKYFNEWKSIRAGSANQGSTFVHEAAHEAFRMFTTPQEKKNLIDKVVKKVGKETLRKQWGSKTAAEKYRTESNAGFDADVLTDYASNSLVKSGEGLNKSDNLRGKGVSYTEAKTGLARNGKYLKDRIVFGVNDDKQVILKDGRHLLEAYRQLDIRIPADKVSFEDGLQDTRYRGDVIDDNNIDAMAEEWLVENTISYINNKPKTFTGKIKQMVDTFIDRWFRTMDNIKDIEGFYKALLSGKLLARQKKLEANQAKNFKKFTASIQGAGTKTDIAYRTEVIAQIKKLTTKILKRLEGKTTVKKQFISDLTKQQDIKQVEKDIINDVLKNFPDQIDVKTFEEKVIEELLPLRRVELGETHYDSYTLEVDRDSWNYSENIYASPIPVRAGNIHFSDQMGLYMFPVAENYFGHTRVQDNSKGTIRRVVEMQTDLYQKGNIESETVGNMIKRFQIDYEEDIKRSKKNIRLVKEELASLKRRLIDPEERDSEAFKEGLKKEIKRIEKWIVDSNKQLDSSGDRLKSKIRLTENSGRKKLEQYKNFIAQLRLLREEVRQASIDGIKKLLFPTGKTIAYIEGFMHPNKWTTTDGEVLKDGKNLKYGDIIVDSQHDDRWLVMDVDKEDNKKVTIRTLSGLKTREGSGTDFDLGGVKDTLIKSFGFDFYRKGLLLIPKDSQDVIKYIKTSGGKVSSELFTKMLTGLDSHAYKFVENKYNVDTNGVVKLVKDEGFEVNDLNDISNIYKDFTWSFEITYIGEDKVVLDNPTVKTVMDFYENTVGKYVKNQYGAKLYTDENENTWWEVDIKPEYSQAVEAFRVDDSIEAEAKKFKTVDEFIKARFEAIPEYGMSHRPTWEDMPRAFDLLETDTLPKDVYEHPEWSLSPNHQDKANQQSWDALLEIRGQPDAKVTVYRAGKKDELNTGDWITFSKEYAGMELSDKDTKVYSFEIKAEDAVFAGDDVNEFGYYPRSELTDIWEKAQEVKPKRILKGKTFYHGTLGDFDKFSMKEVGKNTNYDNAKFGIFFTEDQDIAKTFTENTRSAGDTRDVKVKEVKLDLRNPLDLRVQNIAKPEQAQLVAKLISGEDYKTVKEAQEFLEMATNTPNDYSGALDSIYSLPENKGLIQDAGFDGIVSRMGKDVPEYVVFDTKQIIQKGAPSGAASVGLYSGISSDGAAEGNIKPMELPEINKLYKEISGKEAIIRKSFRGKPKAGLARGKQVELLSTIFQDSAQAQRTFAHEIGHVVDFLPEGTLKRGRLIGHIAGLGKNMKQVFGDMNDKEIREEVYELSKKWKPFDENMDEAFTKYRKQAAELYADMVSIMINDPKLLKQEAPNFWNGFFEYLHKKPEVKKNFENMWDSLLKDRSEILTQREQSIRDMYRAGEEKNVMVAEIAQKEKKGDFMRDVKDQLIDKNSEIIAQKKKAKEKGNVVSSIEDPEYAVEGLPYVNGYQKDFVQSNYQTVKENLEENGLTWEDLAEYLFLDRIVFERGELTAKELWDAMEENLDEETYQEIAKLIPDKDRTSSVPGQLKKIQNLYKDVRDENGLSPYENIITLLPNRLGIANPLGFNTKTAKEQKDFLLKNLGKEKAAILNDAVKDFREATQKILNLEGTEDFFAKDTLKEMRANPAYATFQVIDYMDTFISAKVKQQMGSLKGVSNVATSTVQKNLATISAIERNNAKNKTIDFIKKYNSEDITEARTKWNGKGYDFLEPKSKKLALLVSMKDGKLQGYNVDKYIAKAFDVSSDFELKGIVKVLQMMNSKWFRPAYVGWNVGFQTFNFVKDFSRFWKNTPNLTFVRAVKRYAQASSAAWARATNKKNDLLSEMYQNKALSITYSDIIEGATDETRQIDRIMNKFGLLSHKQETKKVKQTFNKFFNALETTGDYIESIPKVAGYIELKEQGKMESNEMAHFIRNYVGSPNFLRKGSAYNITNNVFLFSNAIKEGWRSDIEIATNPQTRAGFWFKTAQRTFLPKLLMFLALKGLFGEWLKDFFEKNSEYDKTNYTLIPLGKIEDQALTLRVPEDETSRFMGGVFWKALNLAFNNKEVKTTDFGDLIAYFGGQLPTVSPATTLLSSLFQMVAGQNPYDAFRNRNVINPYTFEKGGIENWKIYGEWLWEQMGGRIIYQPYDQWEEDKGEDLQPIQKAAHIPVLGNVISRWVKLTDYGIQEKEYAAEAEAAKEKAREDELFDKKISTSVEKYVENPDVEVMKSEVRKLQEEKLGDRPFGGWEGDESRQATQIRKDYKLEVLEQSKDSLYAPLLKSGLQNSEKLVEVEGVKEELSSEEFKTYLKTLRRFEIISLQFITLMKDEGVIDALTSSSLRNIRQEKYYLK